MVADLLVTGDLVRARTFLIKNWTSGRLPQRLLDIQCGGLVLLEVERQILIVLELRAVATAEESGEKISMLTHLK